MIPPAKVGTLFRPQVCYEEDSIMNTYTVFAYIIPEGGHHVETITAPNATAAAIALRETLKLGKDEFEVVAVAQGAVAFEPVDERMLALAPYTAASP